MSWVVKQAGRLDDMGHGKLSLRIETHQDGDVCLYVEEGGMPIEDELGNRAVVEFCSSGGRSPRTKAALYALIEAMTEDARTRPDGIPQYPVSLREAMFGTT